jgi:YidC/Oxa1 family membrane protein insertase
MERNTLLAVVLIAVVFILTPYYFNWLDPVENRIDAEGVESISQPEKVVKEIEENLDDYRTPIQNTGVESFSVTTPLYTAEISSKNGGSIQSFRLRNYKFQDSLFVNLITQFNKDNLLINFRTIDGDAVSLDNNWSGVSSNGQMDLLSRSGALQFVTSVENKTITKTLTFNPESYIINIDISFARATELLSQGEYGLSWDGGLPTTEKNQKDDRSYFEGNALLGTDVHSTKLSANKLTEDKLRGTTRWVSIRSKYFTSSIIPNQPSIGAIVKGTIEEDHPLYSISLINNASLNTSFKLYLGPLQKDLIENLGVGLEKTMNFGVWIFRYIAKAVLWSLKKMHSLIPNYGVVLIIFAFLIKMLIYPLTKKSYQSSREMQAIQPLIAKIKEKYKHDPKRLNQEQMKLFKEHGVNPLGGCLPLLLQMPLLMSLFIVFRSTIELRGQPFVLWITDLSSPDTIAIVGGFPLNILPIFMAITMFIQQKMMQPTSGDSQNKLMMYGMNVFFLFIFYSFPSGLNLYYALFNLFTILQQKFLTPAKK